MRLLLILLLLVGLGRATASAQVVAPALPTDSLAQRPLDTDTVAALHRLYHAKRHARTRVVLTTLGVATATFVIGGAIGASSSSPYGMLIAPYFTLLFGVPIISGELLYYGQYSRRNERFAVEDFQAHKLSWNVKAKLMPRYFQPVLPAK